MNSGDESGQPALLPADELVARAARVRLAVFDVDGVMTDGRLYYTHDGHELKAFHSQDGLGLKRLLAARIAIAVITGRRSPVVERRMAELGIEHLFQGRIDKLAAFEELTAAVPVPPERVCYVGDDVIDLPLLERVGLAITVPNAHPAVPPKVHWITPRAGGEGAVRDVCDLLLKARSEG